MHQRALVAIVMFVAFASVARASPAPPSANFLMADELGLLSPSDSSALTERASAGVHSATKIQPLVSPQELSKYKLVFNSTAVMANFQLTTEQRDSLNSNINALLQASKRVQLGSAEQAQLTSYSAISVRKGTDGSAILEVLVGLADMQKARGLASEGPVQALIKSTVWVGVSRQKVSWADISANGDVSFKKVNKDVAGAYHGIFGVLLLAF